MFPGPIIEFEARTQARKARYHLLRIFVGLFLLYFLWINYITMVETDSDGLFTLSQINSLSAAVFGTVAVGQYALVLLVAPALVAATIADEKQRKTLHYLLTTTISGPGIVLGKITIRLMQLGLLLLVGMPIMSMLVLMGGVDPRVVGLAYLVTMASAFFLASIAVLMSTLSRRVRDAAFASYAIMLAWLILLPLFSAYTRTAPMPLASPAVSDFLQKVAEALMVIHPMSVVEISSVSFVRVNLGASVLFAGLQFGIGLILVLIAGACLRSVFRSQDGRLTRKEKRGKSTRPSGMAWLRHRLRPPCGDRPMLWKEKRTLRKAGLARKIGRFAMFLFLLAIGYQTLTYGIGALVELLYFAKRLPWWLDGLRELYQLDSVAAVWMQTRNRMVFSRFLGYSSALISFFALLGIATSAASGVTSEREGDTWISLTTTDLSGGEILRAKIAGAVHASRWSLRLLVFMWLLGWGAGSLHPAGLVLSAAQLWVYAWAMAALGTFVSLLTKTTYRAQFLTIGGFVFLNLFGQGCMNVVNRLAPQLLPGFMPIQIQTTLYWPEDFEYLLTNAKWAALFDHRISLFDMPADPRWMLLIAIASTLFHAGVGLWMYRSAGKLFDRVVGRAARPSKVLDAMNLKIEAN